jgi:hypothetical protein
VADDVMKKAAADAQPAPKGATLPAHPESRADRARRFAYRSRFAAFYFLLAIVGGASVGALVVLVSRGSPAPAPAWSEWEPTGSGQRRAAQIADRVGDGYRLPSGNALAPVTYSGPPTITLEETPIQISALAVETPVASRGGDDIDVFESTSNVMYLLCGRGVVCTIAEGEDSADRRRLIRRQALELALYSFKHIEGIETVLVLLPPRVRANDVTPAAMFFQRGDLERELTLPLNETLTAPLTPSVGEIGAGEIRTIDRLTGSRVYTYSPLQQQNGGLLLNLVPIPN